MASVTSATVAISNKIMKILFAIFLTIAAANVCAQGQYATDLTDNFATFKSLFARAERVSPTNRRGKLSIQTEAVNLQEKLSALSLGASEANLALAKGGDENDRNLLLVSSSAESLILANNLLVYYLNTGDKGFLVQSNAATTIARSLRDAIK